MKINKSYSFKAPVEKVWQALTDSKLMDAWHAGPATFESTEGGKFSLWGGEMHGTNKTLIPNQLLVQDWYGGKYPDKCYEVSFSFQSKGDSTILKLAHEGINDDEYDDFVSGWKDYYFDPIKKLIET